MVRFQLLGAVQVTDGDRVITIDGTKARALLAVLLINLNSVVSTSRLVEHLWGDDPPVSAIGTLHAYVSRLRRLLGPDVLLTRRPGYLLKIDPDQLDVRRFERLLAQGMAEVRSGDPRRAVAALREALALWQGPCLAEFADQPFAADEVARMEGLRTSAVEECMGAELAMGRHAEVVEELRALVVEHPTREGLWSHLMLALYRCGRQAEALDAFRNARARLNDELGIEPGPALRTLQAGVLNHDPELAWTPPNPLPVALGHSGDRSLVGRTSETTWLRNAWRRTCDGVAGVVLLTGEPGVGKTRLATDLSHDARDGGGTVLWGRAMPNSLVPYEPFAEALRDYADRFSAPDLANRVGPAAADLGLLIPGLPEAPAATRVPKARRYRMFEAVADLLRASAAEAPVLLILDDLHWADRSTLLLLDHLARHPRRATCLILLLCRESELTPEQPAAALMAGLRADGLAEHLRLDGLPLHDVEQLVHSISGVVPSPELARAVHERTDGNPLFVEEIMRSLQAAGTDPETAVRKLAVPERIRDLIAQRLTRMPAAARSVLSAASAIGHEFTLGVLAAVVDEPEATVTLTLEHGIETGVIREQGAGPGRYVFAHPLIHDAVYEGLTRTRRALLHERAGEILHRLGADGNRASLGEMAHHFHQSAINDANRAVEYALLAGDEAMALLGFAEARTHYERALKLLSLAEPADADDRRVRLLLALGQARLGEYDAGGARAAHLEAARLAMDRKADDDLARAVLGLVWGIEFGEVDAELVTQLEDALARLDLADSPLRAKLLASLSRALHDQDPRVPGLASDAVAMARRLTDPDTLAFVLSATLLATWAADNSDERLAVAGELISLSDELGWVELTIESLNWRSVAMEERGDLARSDADLATLSDLAQQARRPFYTATVALREGSRALAQGRYADAERLATTMLANGGDGRNFRSAFGLQMFHHHRDRGRLADIAEQTTVLIESRPDTPAWRCALALLHIELGDRDRATAELRELTADDLRAIPRDWLWVGALGHLAEVCTALGDAEAAPALLRLLQKFAHTNLVVANGALNMGATARSLGSLSAILGLLDEAEEHFRAAIEVNWQWRARPWLARTQIAYADLLRRRDRPGDRAHAEKLTATARTGAARVGMRLPEPA